MGIWEEINSSILNMLDLKIRIRHTVVMSSLKFRGKGRSSLE